MEAFLASDPAVVLWDARREALEVEDDVEGGRDNEERVIVAEGAAARLDAGWKSESDEGVLRLERPAFDVVSLRAGVAAEVADDEDLGLMGEEARRGRRESWEGAGE